jgi:ribosomal protein L3
MAGQHGNATVTVQNLKVVKVDAEHNLLLIKGAVPGAKNGYLVIRPAVKKVIG